MRFMELLDTKLDFMGMKSETALMKLWEQKESTAELINTSTEVAVSISEC
jgi:hypothetical protein